MLVLTRKLSEKLYIGGNICVTVVRLDGGQVRLGIDAPREVPVIRAELVAPPAAPAPVASMVTADTPSSRPPRPALAKAVRALARVRPQASPTRGTGSRRRARSQ